MGILRDIVDGARLIVTKKSKSSLPEDFITSVGREEFTKARLDERFGDLGEVSFEVDADGNVKDDTFTVRRS